MYTRPDPLAGTLIHDHDTPQDRLLNRALRLSAPADATLEIIPVTPEMAGVITELYGLDAHDDTPEAILRFPGAPDAYAGSTRGMQSYDAWLYFGPEGNGRRIEFPRTCSDGPVNRYRIILGETLGRAIHTPGT